MEVSLYELQSGSNTNHSGNLGFRNLWSSRSGSQTLRQKGSDSQTERRGEEEDWMWEVRKRNANREEEDENEE